MRRPSYSSALVQSLESRRLLSAGVLDTSFATAGRAVLPFIDGRIIGTQPNGQIIVEQFTYGSSSVHLWRVNPDGTIDSTFHSDVLSNFPVPQAPGDTGGSRDGDFKVSPTDGRIAYVVQDAAYPHEVAVLNPDGTPDASFDGDGIRDMTAGLETWDQRPVRDLAWQGSNLVVASQRLTAQGSNTQLVSLARLLSDGTTDLIFGVAGETSHADPGGTIPQIGVAPIDNRVLLSLNVTGHVDVTQYSANGQLVSGYGNSGTASIATPSNADGSIGFNVAPDGSVYELITTGGASTQTGVKLAELTPTGATGVAKTFSFASGDTNYIGDVKPNQTFRQADGKWLLIGPSSSTAGGWGVTRLNADGSKDTTYGTSGTAIADVGYVTGSRAQVLNDGRVYVGGKQYKSKATFQVVRLTTDLPIFTLNKKGTLVGTTDDRADNITLSIRAKDGRMIFRDGVFAQSFTTSKVKRIALFTNGGDDVATNNLPLKGIYCESGDGNDTLNGGIGDDVLLGNAGDDQLFGNDGNDKLLGGDGNDYCLGGAGKDDLFGDAGVDTLSGAGANDRLFGGAGADNINGGSGTDSSENDPADTRISVETLL
jgi:uncharacterized delta-60 repeat protein